MVRERFAPVEYETLVAQHEQMRPDPSIDAVPLGTVLAAFGARGNAAAAFVTAEERNGALAVGGARKRQRDGGAPPRRSTLVLVRARIGEVSAHPTARRYCSPGPSEGKPVTDRITT